MIVWANKGKKKRTRTGVMHVTDSLRTGGTEQVAVNLANFLPRERYLAYLCNTRHDGPLADRLAPDVKRLPLRRRHRFDSHALRRLIDFIQAHDIRIIHAHSSSLFIAGLASLFPPYPVVVWHDHFGRSAFEDRPAWLYRLATRRVSGVIAVNQPLAEWSRSRLGMPANRVWYVPNFVCEATLEGDVPVLPGKAGGRIVCVANFRPQKDHLTVLRAMVLVIQQMPSAHLLLVGDASPSAYLDLVRREISRLRLDQNVSLLGERHDIYAILRACDIGVLGSASEGLPLALIEYGMSRLPAVATEVGQCAEVLEGGRTGILVPPASPEKLAEALLSLLRSSVRRGIFGERFHRRVREIYSPGPVVEQICRVYDTLIGPEPGVR